MGPASIGLRPSQPVEWWIGGHAAASLRRAAQLGSAWYGGPGLDRSTSERLIGDYRAECDRHGTKPRAIVRRDVLVLADADRARAEGAALVGKGYRGLDLRRLIVGGPDDAIAAFRALADTGYDDVIVRCMSPDQAEALETIELVGSLDRQP
jgi:alkanesulfonate monooxygenase SsuD/methylene tetrahydromethanopterin reductase-like flavin-dependent oxidoreductase (luciferase family)